MSVEVSTLPAFVDLNIYNGDTWQQAFRFRDGEDPHDLAGAELESWARDRAGRTTPLVVRTGEDAGMLAIELPSAGLSVGGYDYDIRVVEGTAVKTWVRGRLRVVHNVTGNRDENDNGDGEEADG